MKDLIRNGKDTTKIGLYYVDENGRYWYPQDDKFPMTNESISTLTNRVDNLSNSVRIADKKLDNLYTEGFNAGVIHGHDKAIGAVESAIGIGLIVTIGVVGLAMHIKSKKDNKKK